MDFDPRRFQFRNLARTNLRIFFRSRYRRDNRGRALARISRNNRGKMTGWVRVSSISNDSVGQDKTHCGVIQRFHDQVVTN